MNLLKFSDVKISPARIVMGENALSSSEEILNDFIYNHSPSAVSVARHHEDKARLSRSVFLVEKKIFQKYRREFGALIKVAKPSVIFFSGECSLEEVSRLYKEVKKNTYISDGINEGIIVFAAGGGKVLDASKLVAEKLGSTTRLVTIPTSCATCAAFTPIAPTYYPDGRKRKTINLSRPPDLMIVDYGILLRQPPRLLVAGIADAVAKYYETKAFVSSLSSGNHSYKNCDSSFSDGIDLSVRTAEAISDQILKGAFEISHYALRSLEKGENSRHFQEIVYLTLIMTGLVSGIGGKKCRTVAAHALANGLTYIPSASRASLHGEKVGWGTLVQLVLEGKFSELEELRSFFISIRSPVKMEALFSGDGGRSAGRFITEYRLLKKAFEVACAPDESMKFMPRKITPRMAYEAAMYLEKMR